MPYQTTTQTTAASTTPGAGTAMALNWRGGKPATVSLTWASSTGFCDSQIQYTLDDIQLVTSSLVTWLPLASTAASSVVAHFASTTWFDTGYTVSFLNPIAAVRSFSSGITAGATQSITMKLIQGEGW